MLDLFEELAEVTTLCEDQREIEQILEEEYEEYKEELL